jgi:hypothetical protein
MSSRRRRRALLLLCLMPVIAVLAGKRGRERTLSREDLSFVPATPAPAVAASVGIQRSQKALRFVQPTGMTYLETRSVRQPTINDYQRRIDSFLGIVRQMDMAWSNARELDCVVVEVLESMFFAGRRADEGSRLVAAIKFFIPDVSRMGEAFLPRCSRALKGWSLTAPGNQRLPMPVEVMGAMAGYMLHQSQPQMAMRLFLSFACYLRPGEAEDLRIKQLVPPVSSSRTASRIWSLLLSPIEDGIPGKTNIFDETVVMDSDPWLDPYLWALHGCRDPEERLWSHSYASFQALFMQAATILQLGALGLSVYSLRHGGASFDLLTRRRTLAEVKRRGRWAADSSVRRYGKEGRLHAETLKVPPAVLAFGQAVLLVLPLLFHNNRQAMPPIPW